MVWYSHLFQNFPQFIVIHTVECFGIVNKAEIDVFMVVLFLDLGTSILFYLVAVSVYVPTNSVRWFSFLHTSLIVGFLMMAILTSVR